MSHLILIKIILFGKPFPHQQNAKITIIPQIQLTQYNA